MQDRHTPQLPHSAGPVTGAVRRLTVEFDGRVRPRTLRRTVQRARRDLAGVPEGALPELVERLARERLRSAPSARR
ncbi:hypothetical protein I4I73_21445 [Pseudonocardia sp. KRD-184]|uniref:Uncharacterized protein n=1 Tax=Pseudonocardia oceani TaxID=2792013 RepID=A0ABS6UIJ3_9PSEU|nr:hypothetical protein [Pseudonocardia oceani]MBW0092474.1 hypothetical protein [Pseudonocardia oceani]MBW0098557.1 hypothetical protein [Pseudonocardia oceani]MBW0111954.1 hypothetical protein [Pseudonocardia oceani]MBW0124094.1 hypothetical protein [Pseudonocardia oceani]MBW0131728.1 hypothetical protein [Pseudonocardia oceani]